MYYSINLDNIDSQLQSLDVWALHNLYTYISPPSISLLFYNMHSYTKAMHAILVCMHRKVFTYIQTDRHIPGTHLYCHGYIVNPKVCSGL